MLILAVYHIWYDDNVYLQDIERIQEFETVSKSYTITLYQNHILSYIRMDSHIVYYYYLITDYSHYQFNTAKMPFNGMTYIYNMNDIFVIICVTVLLSQISDVLVIILIVILVLVIISLYITCIHL